MQSQLFVICQGVKVSPWFLSKRLRSFGLRGDVRVAFRNGSQPNAVIELISIGPIPIEDALATAGPLQDDFKSRLEQFIDVLREHAQSVQMVVRSDRPRIDSVKQMWPAELAHSITELIGSGNSLVFLRSDNPFAQVH